MWVNKDSSVITCHDIMLSHMIGIYIFCFAEFKRKLTDILYLFRCEKAAKRCEKAAKRICL